MAYVKRNKKLSKLYLEFCRSVELEEIHYLLIQIIRREAPLMACLEWHANTSFLHNFALNMLKDVKGGRRKIFWARIENFYVKMFYSI